MHIIEIQDCSGIDSPEFDRRVAYGPGCNVAVLFACNDTGKYKTKQCYYFFVLLNLLFYFFFVHLSNWMFSIANQS